jgi:hypothetical protein
VRSVVNTSRAPYLRVHGTEPQASIKHATGLAELARTGKRKEIRMKRLLVAAAVTAAAWLATPAAFLDFCPWLEGRMDR